MKILKSSEGIALFVAILVMTIVMLFLGASLFLSRVDTKITSNFKLGTQALEVADAGLQHGLTLLQRGTDFDGDLNCGTPPCNLLSATPFPAGSDFTYTVTVENDSPDINNGGSPTNDTDSLVVLVSTANGPNGVKRQVQAYVNRSLVSFTPPGALYLPASSATVDFGGSTGFFITGDDTDYDGATAGPQPPITGVAPIYSGVLTTFLFALGPTGFNLVQGAGYSTDPLTPSVFTTSDVLDVNQIAVNFFNHASAIKYLDGVSTTRGMCPDPTPDPPPSACVFGTDSSPQITYIRENGTQIHFGGNVTGSGILVTEGSVLIRDNFDFHGLIIKVDVGLTGGSSGAGIGFTIQEDAKIFGSLLMGPTNGSQVFNMYGNAKIYYNSSALTMGNSLCGTCFPQAPRISVWLDKF